MISYFIKLSICTKMLSLFQISEIPTKHILKKKHRWRDHRELSKIIASIKYIQFISNSLVVTRLEYTVRSLILKKMQKNGKPFYVNFCLEYKCLRPTRKRVKHKKRDFIIITFIHQLLHNSANFLVQTIEKLCIEIVKIRSPQSAVHFESVMFL